MSTPAASKTSSPSFWSEKQVADVLTHQEVSLLQKVRDRGGRAIYKPNTMANNMANMAKLSIMGCFQLRPLPVGPLCFPSDETEVSITPAGLGALHIIDLRQQ